jgi:hypothetical protein
MAMALEPQHTLPLSSPSPTKVSTKRKPSARAAFRMDEIPTSLIFIIFLH